MGFHKKSDGTRLAPIGISRTSEVALRRVAGLAYDPRSWVAGVWTKKNDILITDIPQNSFEDISRRLRG